jgi:hypothetical protein
MSNSDLIPTLQPIRSVKDFKEFILNFPKLWDDLVRAIGLIKSELQRLQAEKQDV